MWEKSCAHINRTRTPHPHRETAPTQMSPHKFSPQLQLQICHLLLGGQLSCKILYFLGTGLFFRPRRILIFCRLVNTLVLEVSSKKVLLKVLVTRFLRKQSKFKRFLHFSVAPTKKSFFSPLSVAEHKTDFFLVAINF